MKLSTTQNTVNFSGIGFLRLPQVLKIIPISKTVWYEGIREGIYPKPVKLGKRTSAWRVEDIHSLVAELGSKS